MALPTHGYRPVRELPAGIRLDGRAADDVLDMDEGELSWQDVLFAGIAVLVEATVCGLGVMIVRARGRASEGSDRS